MSTTIDSKVVEMRFDNKHFENNVSTSMSTLDKLKAKLNLSGASKGLENVNNAAKKVDMNGLASGVETVRAKFSALEVMGVTALANITNSAVNAAKNFVSALTIAPIADGWQEYEMTLNAIQTTMAGTGKTAAEVEQELKKLDEYADKTVYSTADMLNNLPKFTNAGVELEKATTAMIGIANATALAGGDAGKASIAFYNLGQAIGTGYLTRMDYNSINNAGIATMEWKNQMVEAAIAQGTLTKVGEDAYKAGNKTLTLQQLFIDGLQEQWATTDVLMKVFGDYGNETTEIGKKAYSAAQDIKTFSMMMDSLKATAGTGWKDTWQIIFGGLEEAKQFWTGLTNFISGIITKMADLRNAVLESALGRSFTELRDRIYDAMRSADKITTSFMKTLSPVGKAFDKVNNAVSNVTKTLEEHGAVVQSVIRGDWGNTEERWNALTEAGYDWAHVQNLVNEELGDSTRHTSKFTENLKNQSAEQGKTTKGQIKMTDALAKQIATLSRLDDRTLRALGYTDKQIESFRELNATAKMLGLSTEEFLRNIDEIDGRWLVINSFKNIGKSLIQVFTVIKDAWLAIFAPNTTAEDRLNKTADGLFNIIAALHRFSTKLKMSDATAEKFQRTMQGVFAVVDIVATLFGGAFKFAVKAVMALLKYFDLDILDVTASIGDALVAFRDWIDSVVDFDKIFSVIIPPIAKVIKAIRDWIVAVVDFKSIVSSVTTPIKNAITAIKDWIVSLKDSENLPYDIAQGIIKGLGKAFEFVKNLIKSVIKVIRGETDGVGSDIISGLVNGIWNGIKLVGQVMIELGKALIEKIKDVLGIHSPSTVFIAIGGFILAGLLMGLSNGFPAVFDFFKNMVSKIMDFFKGIDLGTLIAGAIAIGAIVAITKIANALESLASPLEGFGDLCEDLGRGIKAVGKGVKNYLNSQAMLNFAKALAILAGVILGGVLLIALIGPEKLWPAVGVMAALSAIMLALIGVMYLMGKMENGLKMVAQAMFIAAIAGALLLVAVAMNKLANIPLENVGTTLMYLVIGLGAIAAIMVALSKLTSISENIAKAGTMMVRMAIAIGLMVLVIKMASKLDADAAINGLGVVALVSGLFMAMAAIIRTAEPGAFWKSGQMMVKMAIALGLMVGVIKLAAKLDVTEIQKGLKFVAGVGLLFAAFAFLTKFAKKDISKVGSMVLSLSIALAIMVGVVKLISKIDDEEFKRGIGIILTLEAMLALLVLVAKNSGKNIGKAGAMLMSVAGVLAILTGLILIMSLIDGSRLWKAVGAIVALEACLAGLLFVTKYAKLSKNTKSVLISLIVLVGLLGGLIIAMSFLDPAKVATATAAMSSVMGMFALLLFASSFLKSGEKTWKRNLATIVVLTLVVAALGTVIYELAQCDPKSAMGAAVSLGTLLLALSAAFKILAGSKSMTKGKILPMAGSLAALVVILAGLGLVLAMMSGLGVKDAIPNTLALSALLVVLAGVAVVLSKFGSGWKNILGASLGMAALTGVLALLGLVLAMMSALDVKNAMPNVMALSALIVVLTGVAVVMSIFGAGWTNILGASLGMAALAGVLALLGLVLAMMSALKVKDVMPNVKALSALMVVLTGVAVVMSIFGAGWTNILGASLGMAALVGVLALIGLVLAMMTAMKVKDAMSNVKALSAMIVVLTGVAVVMSIFGALAVNIAMGALGMAALVGVLALIGLVLAMMTALNIKNGVENAKILSNLIIVLTGVATVLALIGFMAPNILMGALGLGALTVIMTLLGLVLAMMSALDVKNGMENAQALSLLLTTMAGVCVVLAAVGPMASAGIPAMYSLLGLIVAFGALAVAVGALMDKFPALQSFLDTGIPVLEQLANGIGSVVGNLISGFAEGLTTDLPVIGQRLADFMTNAKVFIDGAKTIDETVLNGIGYLSGAVLALTAADMMNGLTSWLSDGASFAQLGTDLSEFMTNALPFILGTKMIDASMMESVKTLAEAMVILTGASILDGLTSWIAGDVSLADFGAELAAFGPGLKMFADSVSGITPEMAASIQASVEAAKGLADMASVIPNSGGLAGLFAGENDLADFGGNLAAFGSLLMLYGQNVSGIESYTASIEASATAAKGLADMAAAIPNEGGLAGLLAGENDLATFGGSLAAFGRLLMLYGQNVSGIESYNESITASVTAAQGLADVAKAIPNEGGVVSWFTGDNNIAMFGYQLVAFGQKLIEYGRAVVGIGAYTESIKASVVAAQAMLHVARTAKDISAWDWGKSEFTKFGENLVSFGTSMYLYANAIGQINVSQLSGATNEFNRLAEMATKVNGIDFTGMSAFASSLSLLGKSGVDKFIEAFTKASDRVNKAGGDMIMHLVSGVEDKSSKLTTAFTSTAADAVEALKEGSGEFYNAGSYLVEGFASGISENTFKAEAQAYAMAKAAAQAAEEALDINSPSKVFRAIGYSVPEGFAMGIDKLSGMVSESTIGMGNTALTGINNSMSRIMDAINSDMDTQPTIRPVLDLSEVRSGTSAIASMFGFGATVGVSSNIGAISSMMNQNRQNGSNEDVVSAINRLRKDLGNVGNTTYSINGVTYDDGSNIADAVGAIARAIKMERRV